VMLADGTAAAAGAPAAGVAAAAARGDRCQ
jgi:hypothetical protein